MRRAQITLICLGLFLGTPAAWSEDTPNTPNTPDTSDVGARYQNQCTRCHRSELYTRPDRKVNSRKALDRQVRRCELALNLRWFDEEIAEMVEYLDAHYYHFRP